MRQILTRIQTNREVVNVWLKSISVLAQGKSKEVAARHLFLDLGADPLPIVSVK